MERKEAGRMLSVNVQRRAQKRSVELIPPEVVVAVARGAALVLRLHSHWTRSGRSSLAHKTARRTDSRRRQTMTTIHPLSVCLIVETRLPRRDADCYRYSSSPSASSSSPIASSDAGGLPAVSPSPPFARAAFSAAFFARSSLDGRTRQLVRTLSQSYLMN